MLQRTTKTTTKLLDIGSELQTKHKIIMLSSWIICNKLYDFAWKIEKLLPSLNSFPIRTNPKLVFVKLKIWQSFNNLLQGIHLWGVHYYRENSFPESLCFLNCEQFINICPDYNMKEETL